MLLGTATHSLTFTTLKSDFENVSKSTVSSNKGSISMPLVSSTTSSTKPAVPNSSSSSTTSSSSFVISSVGSTSSSISTSTIDSTLPLTTEIISVEVIKATGVITSNKDVLAQNVTSYKLIAYLAESRTTKKDNPQHVVDKDATAEALAPILGYTKEEILNNLTKPDFNISSNISSSIFSSNFFENSLYGIYSKIFSDSFPSSSITALKLFSS